MLRDIDLQDEFARLTSGVPIGRGPELRRKGWAAMAGGVAIQGIGLVVATFGGDTQATGAGRGATRIGHDVLLVGLAVAVLGALLAAAGPRLYGAGARAGAGFRALRVAAPVLALALVVAGAGVLQRTALRQKPANVTVSAAAGPVGASSAGLPASTNPDVAAAATIPDVPLDPATRAKLAAQLTEARAVALRYPTVADALRAGMYLAGGFAPGSGAHYIYDQGAFRGLNPDGTVNPDYPASFIYDGTSPTSRIVGLMYVSLTSSPPEGFAGPNDHWHRHFNLCIKMAGSVIQVPFPADADVTKAQCDAVGGTFMPKTVWMVHAWVVPGWESPLGVFSHANPDLRCADGTFDTDARGFCQGT